MLEETETLTEQNTETLQISASAAQAVTRILTERKLEGYALRVYVAGGGCCGVSFGMALDNNKHPNDTTFQLHGVQIVVDDQSLPYLQGAKIDFVDDPERGPGFIVDSPVKNSASCGCNSGEESGCGGSCG